MNFKSLIILILLAGTLSACASVFGPKITYLEKPEGLQFERTKKVNIYFSESITPKNKDINSALLPISLKYKTIAKVRVEGEVPYADNTPSFYAPLRAESHAQSEFIRTHLAVMEALESEAKEVGANVVIITKMSTVNRQRVDSVYMTLGKKIVYGPWFRVPVIQASLVRSESSI